MRALVGFNSCGQLACRIWSTAASMPGAFVRPRLQRLLATVNRWYWQSDWHKNTASPPLLVAKRKNARFCDLMCDMKRKTNSPPHRRSFCASLPTEHMSSWHYLTEKTNAQLRSKERQTIISPPLLVRLVAKVLDRLVVDQRVHGAAAGLALRAVHLAPEARAPLHGVFEGRGGSGG